MSFNSNLRKARVNSQMTQQQVADILGVDKTTYSGYETGKRQPDVLKIKELAKTFNVSGDLLLETGYEQPVSSFLFEEYSYIKKYRALDTHGKKIVDYILDEEYTRSIACQALVKEEKEPSNTITLDYYDLPASAGIGAFMFDVAPQTIEVPLNATTKQASFVIPISGDSMSPKFEDGDNVLVKSQPTLNVGEIGIFVFDGDVFIKKLGKNKLISLNNDYDDVSIKEFTSVACLGKVLAKL